MNTWAASAEIYQLWMLNLAVRARLSRASGAGIATKLAVYGFGLDPLPVLHFELGGGTRSTANTLFGINDRETWQSGSMDLSLVRRAYMNLSFESHHDGLAPSKQVYSSLSWTY